MRSSLNYWSTSWLNPEGIDRRETLLAGQLIVVVTGSLVGSFVAIENSQVHFHGFPIDPNRKLMQIAQRLLDQMAFSATTDMIDPENRTREVVEFENGCASGSFEMWGHRLVGPSGSTSEVPWVILKFPGTGGRAEQASTHPAGALPEGSVLSVWAVNPPGYGTSGGKPSMTTMPAVIRCAVARVGSMHPHTRLLVTGNSLGCMWALYAAANCQPDALLLRNPFSLRELISGQWRYNWWNLGAARWIAGAVSGELDAVANARQCHVPCMIVQSGNDSLIPVRFQAMVIEALSGRNETLVIPGADHGDPMPESMEIDFLAIIRRLLIG